MLNIIFYIKYSIYSKFICDSVPTFGITKKIFKLPEFHKKNFYQKICIPKYGNKKYSNYLYKYFICNFGYLGKKKKKFYKFKNINNLIFRSSLTFS